MTCAKVPEAVSFDRPVLTINELHHVVRLPFSPTDLRGEALGRADSDILCVLVHIVLRFQAGKLLRRAEIWHTHRRSALAVFASGRLATPDPGVARKGTSI